MKLFISQMEHLTNPVSYDFTIGEENWIFEVMPEKWLGKHYTYSYNYRIFYFYHIDSVGSYLGLADIKRK